MIAGKCGAVIGYNNLITWKLRLDTFKDTSLPANHGAVFAPVIIKTQNFFRLRCQYSG